MLDSKVSALRSCSEVKTEHAGGRASRTMIAAQQSNMARKWQCSSVRDGYGEGLTTWSCGRAKSDRGWRGWCLGDGSVVRLGCLGSRKLAVDVERTALGNRCRLQRNTHADSDQPPLPAAGFHCCAGTSVAGSPASQQPSQPNEVTIRRRHCILTLHSSTKYPSTQCTRADRLF